MTTRIPRFETYYDVLGVSPLASDYDIKTAYRLLVMRWHPDRNTGDKTAETKLKAINEAYSHLRNHDLRAKYDLMLKQYRAASLTARNDNRTSHGLLGQIWDWLLAGDNR